VQRTVPLEFLVIGAQKCATSWLYLCLAEHPEIAMPRDKRERTYIGGPWFRKHGADAFLKRWDADQPRAARMGDASVDYMYDPSALAAVRRWVGAPKVIASVRDPVARMVSGYHWLYRKGRFDAGESAPAKLASLLAPDGSFRDDLTGTDRELVERGRYARQLRPFLEQLGPDRVLVLGYREISALPAAAVQRVYRFVGVDDRFLPRALDARPKRTSGLRTLHRIERLAAGFAPALRVLDWVNQRVAHRRSAPDEAIPSALRARLAGAYAAERRELERLLDELPPAHRPQGAILL
jgi:hypothetical protein